ncbi:Vitamin B6 photo-protection and homoeostasis domain containing protein [Nitzschia inconspicua]|uniref:Vitamin B6 photo-protection and homoeostasis domain containing protein n=1 Tax=Nitzschia inconspicua TaxID=303405 RepID=A0A9K3PX28_9STRA|nr:Vitamin B6 photo-protection and homoeostasis domain containing protein [Nitzschia inconspicua]
MMLLLILMLMAHNLELICGFCHLRPLARQSHGVPVIDLCISSHTKIRKNGPFICRSSKNGQNGVDSEIGFPLVSDRNVELNTTQALVYSIEEDRFVRDSSLSSLGLSSQDSYSRGLFKIFQHGVARIKRTVDHSFVPQGVNPSYYTYMKWRIMQRFINSNLHVLGTQSLIMGLGLKSSSSLGVSAALTWVLKDALGKLTRLVWASRMGRRFDSDAKRWRFRASLVYALGNYLEIVTYINPALFLLWATAANSCKQVAMLTSSATRTALYNSFRDGKRENIADITAKGEAQIAVVDLIGIWFGVSLSKVVGTSVRSVLCTYVVLQVVEIFLLFQEIRSVQFTVMNFERMAQVVETFCNEVYSDDTEDDGGYITNSTILTLSVNGEVQKAVPSSGVDSSTRYLPQSLSSHGRRLVPSPKEIAEKERIFLPPKHLRRRALAFGSMGRAKLNPDELSRLLEIFSRDRFVLIVGENVKNSHEKVGIFSQTTENERIQQNCHIVLHEDATNLDILKSTLALFLLRRKLVEIGLGPNIRSSDCWDLLEDVRGETDRWFPLLLKQLSLQGWASPSRFMFGRVQQRANWPLSGGNLKSIRPVTPATP